MRIKGTSIASSLAFLEAEYGAARVKQFVESLEPNLRRRCEGVILASAFYPIEDLENLLLAAREFFSPGPDFFQRSGAFNATVGLAGVHKPLLIRPSPLDFLRAAERAWGQFVDNGALEIEVVGDGEVALRLRGFPGSEVFCARETGFLSRSLELAGARRLAVVKSRCTLRGHAWCEWNLAWDPAASPRPQSLTTGIRRPAAI